MDDFENDKKGKCNTYTKKQKLKKTAEEPRESGLVIKEKAGERRERGVPWSGRKRVREDGMVQVNAKAG